MENRTIRLVLSGLLAVLILLLAVSGWLMFQDVRVGAETGAVAQATDTPPTVAVSSTETSAPTLPAPVVAQLPTDTPTATPPPTDTPVPTETPPPTETPEPTATNTPVPAVILPTSTPVPPTAVPAPTQPPVNTRGLSATFNLEGGPIYSVNQEIWFNFQVSNAGGAPVEYGALGVWPRKDGTDRLDWFQYSYTTNAIPVNGFQHRDNIELPEAGNYTLRLAICFTPDLGACQSGGGEWVSLSGEIPITVR